MSKRSRKLKRAHAESLQAQTPNAGGLDFTIAAGLALIVFVRPWRDGASFPGFNAYFVWLAMGLGALWAARLFFRDTTFRLAGISAPLAAFVGFGIVSSFDSYLPDHTYRQILYWTTCLVLFVLAANVLRTPWLRGIFMTAFVITMTASAAWALVHLHYVLPQVREVLEQNPATRQYFFQTPELSRELAHRLSVNRAYGATLFPNALAAFLILALPIAVGEFSASVRDWQNHVATNHEHNPSWKGALAVGGAVALALGLAARLVYPLLYVTVTRSPDWRGETVLTPLVLYLTPAALGAALSSLILLAGWKRTWLYLQLVLLPAAALLIAVALVRTYSRGGMLALLVAVAVVAALLTYRARLRPGVRRGAAAAMLLLFTILTTWSTQAQDAALRSGAEIDVLSTESFMARLDYWRVGLNMIRENPWTGVGLGAFGPAYAGYMFPGAAASQMAHNHFIQVFAETGVFGFVSIVVFWLLFSRFTLRALIGAPDTTAALRIAGPLCGVLAFVVHACVDFNFANPSLAMTAFAVAGVCCARAATVREPAPTGETASRYTAVAVLLIAAIVTSAMIRVYRVDYALTGPIPTARKLVLAGNRLEIRDTFNSAQYYFEKLSEHERDPSTVLYTDYDQLARVVPDHHRILEFGFPAQLDTSAGYRFTPVPPAAPVPPDAIVVITNPNQARKALIASAGALLSDLERIDKLYPYIVEVSMHAYQWCDLVYTHAVDLETKAKFAREGETWARRTLDRSPHQSGAWVAYGKALWQRAATETDPFRSQQLYDEGLLAYRMAAESFPASPDGWNSYATALERLGDSYLKGGNAEKSTRLLAEARGVRDRADELRRAWAQAR